MVPDDACFGADQREERDDERHVKSDALLFDDDERHRDKRILSLTARKRLLIRKFTAVLLQSGRTVARYPPSSSSSAPLIAPCPRCLACC